MKLLAYKIAPVYSVMFCLFLFEKISKYMKLLQYKNAQVYSLIFVSF